MPKMRYSRQREAILSYLKDTYCHPTAETVYDSVKKIYPNLSLGTVYRNLGQLVRQGEIINMTFADGSVHYDFNTEPHHHFFCKCCGAVEDMPDFPDMPHLNRQAAEDFSGDIEGHFIYFYGICKECKKIGNNNSQII